MENRSKLSLPKAAVQTQPSSVPDSSEMNSPIERNQHRHWREIMQISVSVVLLYKVQSLGFHFRFGFSLGLGLGFGGGRGRCCCFGGFWRDEFFLCI